MARASEAAHGPVAGVLEPALGQRTTTANRTLNLLFVRTGFGRHVGSLEKKRWSRPCHGRT